MERVQLIPAFTLAECATRVAMPNGQRQAAFTLAEVLITLGIIGVVAAMTLPSLIHKFQNKTLETQYKKTASIVSQVILKAKADYGLENFAQYCAYYPYDADSGMPYDHDEECYQILYKTLLNVDGQTSFSAENNRYISRYNENIRTYNNKQNATNDALAGIGLPIFQTYAMNDGSYINFRIVEAQLYAGVDTNGRKGPNKLGHDIFIFTINKKNDGLSSYSTPSELSDEELDEIEYEDGKEYQKERAGNPCNLNSSQKANGVGCSYYAIRNECPYDTSKTYFDCLP